MKHVRYIYYIVARLLCGEVLYASLMGWVALCGTKAPILVRLLFGALVIAYVCFLVWQLGRFTLRYYRRAA